MSNPKFDRTAFSALSFEEADKQMHSSVGMSEQDRFDYFNYLMSVAYRFVGEKWPPMDRTVFEMIKRD